MRTRLFPLAPLTTAALAPAPAVADDVTASIPAAAAARNLSGHGDTLAWSQLASEGSSRLVVKVGALAPAEAPIASVAAPVDPDVGPRPGRGARRLDATVPAATDVGDTYAAMLVKHDSRSLLRFATFSGTAKTIAQDLSTDAGGSVYGPPSLTRHDVHRRANDPVNERSPITFG